MIIIEAPKIRSEGDKAVLLFHLTKNELQNNIEIEVPIEYRDFLSTSSDSILIGTLFSAMATGDDIHINGILSGDLLRSFNGPAQTLIKLNKPSLKRIKIVHKGDLESYETGGKHIASGFSGGVDSICTILDYFLECEDDGATITHLMHNNIGRNDLKKVDIERPGVLKAAQELGLPLIEVDSNLSLLYRQPWTPTEYRAVNVHTLWNTCLAVALKNGLKKFYYSSSVPYQYLHFKPHSSLTFIEPELTRLMQVKNMKVLNVGSEYTRVKKTENVAQLDIAKEHLNVCLRSSDDGKRNCGRCSKCKRTLITLELLGEAENFSRVFDLNEWSKVKDEYYWSVKLQKDLFSKEINNKLEELNYKRGFLGLPSAAFKFYQRKFKDFLKKIFKIEKPLITHQ